MKNRFLRYHYLRFIRLQGEPKTLAKGVAIGIFIGITPTIPLHTILILTLCFYLEANTFAAILVSMLVSNPMTFFIQYFLSWWIGSLIFPGVITWDRMHEVMNILQSHPSFTNSLAALGSLGLDAVMVLLCGGIILSLPCAVFAYFYTFRFFTHLRQRTNKKKPSEDEPPAA